MTFLKGPEMKRILITGGAGFVGTNLINLLTNKFHISVMDNLSKIDKFEHQNNNDISFFQSDIRELNACIEATQNIDIIIHLAANGSVIDSIVDPFDNFDNNAKGTLNILHAASENNVKRVIFASTGGALMGDCELPVSEQSIPHPISPYGASKLTGEGYCHAYANSFNMSTTILRFANLYGPYSSHKKGLLNNLINAVKKDSPIEIYGDASRDFLYVEDLCLGIEKVLKYQHKGSEIFHLASGVETKIIDLVKVFLSVSGYTDHPTVFKTKRQGEVERNVANFIKANEKLGFSPSTNITDGLSKTWEWYTQQLIDTPYLTQKNQ